jgi:hypothetical protein
MHDVRAGLITIIYWQRESVDPSRRSALVLTDRLVEPLAPSGIK